MVLRETGKIPFGIHPSPADVVDYGMVDLHCESDSRLSATTHTIDQLESCDESPIQWDKRIGDEAGKRT